VGCDVVEVEVVTGGPDVIEVEVLTVSSGKPSDLAEVALPPTPRGPWPSCGWGVIPSYGAVRASLGRIGINRRHHRFSCWMMSRS
jgi:hypothetical protein